MRDFQAENSGGPNSQSEAAVWLIAEDVVEYLMTHPLTRDDAVATLALGFLKIELPRLPAVITQQFKRMPAATTGRIL